MRSPGQHADAGWNGEGGNEPRRHGRTSRQAAAQLSIRRLATMNAFYHMSAHSSADNPGILAILAKYFCDSLVFGAL
jgi:hypothetical protein